MKPQHRAARTDRRRNIRQDKRERQSGQRQCASRLPKRDRSLLWTLAPFLARSIWWLIVWVVHHHPDLY